MELQALYIIKKLQKGRVKGAFRSTTPDRTGRDLKSGATGLQMGVPRSANESRIYFSKPKFATS